MLSWQRRRLNRPKSMLPMSQLVRWYFFYNVSHIYVFFFSRHYIWSFVANSSRVYIQLLFCSTIRLLFVLLSLRSSATCVILGSNGDLVRYISRLFRTKNKNINVTLLAKRRWRMPKRTISNFLSHELSNKYNSISF